MFTPIPNTHTQHSAFTLIELLIVVAIIAILSAIAVPNFLEAQTRSKTSRSMADMRSIGTGLNSYFIDYNTFPRGFTDKKSMGSYNFESVGFYVNDNNVSNNYELKALTTPIAYLTSVLFDPFNPPKSSMQNGFEYQNWEQQYALMRLMNPSYTGTHTLWYEVRSMGPDKIKNTSHEDNYVCQIYDPTNGTNSAGDILMCERGFVLDAGAGRR